jgi:hypothetical protein
LNNPEECAAGDQEFLDLLLQEPSIATSYPLAQRFLKIVRQRDLGAFEAWLSDCLASGVREMSTFASGLQQDDAAVRAALTVPWSTGQVEGHITRLKLVKRQMYGRAGFDLLRQRVCGAVVPPLCQEAVMHRPARLPIDSLRESVTTTAGYDRRGNAVRGKAADLVPIRLMKESTMKYLISFPSAAMIVPDGEWEAVGRAHRESLSLRPGAARLWVRPAVLRAAQKSRRQCGRTRHSSRATKRRGFIPALGAAVDGTMTPSRCQRASLVER